MIRQLVLIVAVVLAGCGGEAASPSMVVPAPGEAIDADGRFRLTFRLAATEVAVGDAIDGEARLELTAGDAAALSGSGGGLLGFAFRQVDGDIVIEPAWNADCAPHRLAADTPIVSPITKSGGYSEDDPDAAFYRAFFADPQVRLPAGEWEISAVASFIDGAGCDGRSVALRAPVRVVVRG